MNSSMYYADHGDVILECCIKCALESGGDGRQTSICFVNSYY